MVDVNIDKWSQNRARDAIFQAGSWEVASDFMPFTSSESGLSANNNLDMLRSINNRQPKIIQLSVISPMVNLINYYNADGIWAVGQVDQTYTKKISSVLGLHCICVTEVESSDTKAYDFRSEEDERKAEEANVLVALQAASERFTLLNKVLNQSPGLKIIESKTAGIVVGWRRGEAKKELSIGRPISCVLREYIPETITKKDKFFTKYGKHAIMLSSMELAQRRRSRK